MARAIFVGVPDSPPDSPLFYLQCRQAKDAGVSIVISSDAHRGVDFANLQFGIDQGRRGWLTADDVLNTRPLDRLRKRLAIGRKPLKGGTACSSSLLGCRAE